MSFLSPLLRWLRRSPQEEDYATVLENLSLLIERRKSQLSEIRLRERRATLFVTLYAFAAWLIYVVLWYVGFVNASRVFESTGRAARAVRAAPLVLGPIVILFTRRIVQVWYTRKGNAEEKSLRLLQKEQHTKVEEFKKKTGYEKTRKLLELYDDTELPSSPLRPRHVVASVATPQRPPPGLNSPIPAPTAPRSPLQTRYQPPLPVQRMWYDRLADMLLGSEEEATHISASSKYALICEKCFTHNGLADPARWEDAQYICPKCNHFNESVRSKRRALRIHERQSPEPSPSPASSPTRPPDAQRGAGDKVEELGRVQVSEENEKSMMEIDS